MLIFARALGATTTPAEPGISSDTIAARAAELGVSCELSAAGIVLDGKLWHTLESAASALEAVACRAALARGAQQALDDYCSFTHAATLLSQPRRADESLN